MSQQPRADRLVLSENQLKLGTFGTNLAGGATLSNIPGTLKTDWAQMQGIAQTVDRIGLEALVPIARWRGYGGEHDTHSSSLDTIAWAAAVAAVTESTNIFSTIHVNVINPIVAAKQIATIDLVSNGRAGVNLVGGWFRPELEMFGRPMLEHDARYDLAEEWTQVAQQLWSGKDDFDFEGEHFKVVKGFSEPKPRNGCPPIMNAGNSGRGLRYAARFADMAFVRLSSTPDKARDQVNSIKDLAREEFDRSIQVWTYAYISCADTEQAARDYVRYYGEEHADLEGAGNALKLMSIESEFVGEDAWKAMRKDLAAGGGGVPLIGTPEQVVDGLQMISDAGCDGCLLIWPVWEQGLEQLEREILPLLEQAGLRQPFRHAKKPVLAS